MKLLWMLCVLLFLALQVQSIRLCGSELPKMLRKVCANSKRTSMPLANNGIDNKDADTDLEKYDAHLQEQPLLLHRLMKIRRRRHGIVDECCQNSCTFEDLLNYCPK